MRRNKTTRALALSAGMLGALALACSKDEQQKACQPAQAGSCGQQSVYCAQDGQCVLCATGTLNCDGDNANGCEAVGTSCSADPCAGCGAPSCCYSNACYAPGEVCGGSGLTCKTGTCTRICGNVSCTAPRCCHEDVCYDNGSSCGGSGLTCSSGTCGVASDCGGKPCGAPSCCHNDVCYQDGQACGAGLTCQGGTCKTGACGGAVCEAPSCCFANVCYQEGDACGTSGETCTAGACAVVAWDCTLEPGGGPFSNPHADGCRWKWTCPQEGDRELYCETISTKEHTCSCKRDGVEASSFKSIPICTYDNQTIAAQANADCGWNLPTP